MSQGIGKKVIKDFGNEWNEFDQSALRQDELKKLFDRYFHI